MRIVWFLLRFEYWTRIRHAHRKPGTRTLEFGQFEFGQLAEIELAEIELAKLEIGRCASLQAARVSHNEPKESQRALWLDFGFAQRSEFHEETPERGKKKNENGVGEGKTQREILGSPPFGSNPFGRHFLGLGPPTLRAPTFLNSRPPTLRAPLFGRGLPPFKPQNFLGSAPSHPSGNPCSPLGAPWSVWPKQV